MRKLTLFFIIAPFVLLCSSCGIYSFTGASISPDVKTVQVLFFENTAPLVVPYLSQQFTESLKERIRNQTSLSTVNTEGNVIFEGNITDYRIQPIAVQANERSAGNRLTITVRVKFTNNIDPKQSFEQSFTQFEDMPGSNVTAQEPEAIRKVNEKLTQDIFNRAFANW